MGLSAHDLILRLGRGAFASVRRAIGIKDGLTYAVKIIQQRNFQAVHKVMFDREMQILQHLNHKNIVRCVNIFLDPATICTYITHSTQHPAYVVRPVIVMEFVDGGDLLDLVLKSGTGIRTSRILGRHVLHSAKFRRAPLWWWQAGSSH